MSADMAASALSTPIDVGVEHRGICEMELQVSIRSLMPRSLSANVIGPLEELDRARSQFARISSGTINDG